MATHTNLCYQYKLDEADKLVSMVTSSGNVPLDIKLYLSLEKLFYYSSDIVHVEVEKILQKSRSVTQLSEWASPQVHAIVKLADSYLNTGNHEKALDCSVFMILSHCALQLHHVATSHAQSTWKLSF